MTRILIVEDDEKIQAFLTNTINQINDTIEIFTTTNASKALQLAKEELIDIFLVDIQLEDYKGTDLVEQLRALPQYKFTPIIFETAVITEELRAYRDWKCYHYLIKPYTQVEVEKVLKEVLELVEVTKPDNRSLKIEQKQFIFEFRLMEIMYIESFGKNMRIHLLKNGVTMFEDIKGYSLKKLANLLTDSFVQCHKSYVINTAYMERIDKTEDTIKLTNSSNSIPIGDKYRKGVLERST